MRGNLNYDRLKEDGEDVNKHLHHKNPKKALKNTLDMNENESKQIPSHMNQPSTNLSRGLTHLLLYDKQRGDIVKITAGVSKLGFIRISSSSHFISSLHKNSSTEKLNDSFTASSGSCIVAHYDNLNGSSYKASV